jgi:hypothetical protein
MNHSLLLFTKENHHNFKKIRNSETTYFLKKNNIRSHKNQYRIRINEKYNMTEINFKSLIYAIVVGFAAWFWAFIIVGSAVYDFVENKPRTFIFEVYVSLLIINAIISAIVFALYLWKYERLNPIIPDKWVLDAILFGIIISAMNYLFDIIFFGGILQQNLIVYFFIESTAGYFYPLIILEILLLAYLIYGRKQ